MSDLTKKINNFFKFATKTELKEITEELALNEELEKVYNMFYLEHKTISYIAFKLGYSESKIKSDLSIIRNKLAKIYAKNLYK